MRSDRVDSAIFRSHPLHLYELQFPYIDTSRLLPHQRYRNGESLSFSAMVFLGTIRSVH